MANAPLATALELAAGAGRHAPGGETLLACGDRRRAPPCCSSAVGATTEPTRGGEGLLRLGIREKPIGGAQPVAVEANKEEQREGELPRHSLLRVALGNFLPAAFLGIAPANGDTLRAGTAQEKAPRIGVAVRRATGTGEP